MTRYAVLHGPRSGRGHAARRGAEVVARLRREGHEARELEAAGPQEARVAARLAVAEGADVLVVAGGDGVVGIGAAACTDSPTALGIVPSGTGNDNARSLGVATDLDDVVATLLTGTRRPVDLIEVQPSGRLVVGSVPAGIDARIAARATRLPRWLGPAVYAAATLPEIPRLRPEPYRLVLDGQAWLCEALVVATCNMPYYGGGMEIAPEADPSDGLLDVVVIGPVAAHHAVGLLRGVFSGRHLDHPSVQVRRARTVQVTGPALVAHGDGEAIAPLPVTCSVLPAAVDVLLAAP